ncbi:uncharacterized protein CMC5_020300 [Chondromyces crocatus]|uniref:PGRS family protein n=1 Tax=Chondromyces crocatus TaxID=52 RepID=A0A0K1EB20_CHOCO|nr:uncharacterized protein CMC5_020300 [Chondromyces crocatus]
MRAKRWAAGGLLMLAAVGGWTAGCSNEAGDCERSLTCSHYAPGEGGGGGTPGACVPSEQVAGASVANGCGVFVSATGKEGAPGTKEAPVKSLVEAITRAREGGTGRVYACAEDFEEAVELPGGVTLYGGLDCAAGWGWVGAEKKTRVTAGAGEIPLKVRGGEGTARVEDVEVEAAGIDGAAQPELRGASSIAALVEGLPLELVRTALVAGDGGEGEAGAAHAGAAQAGEDGNDGGEACSGAIVIPGIEKVNDCGTPEDTTDDSKGGTGGIGQVSGGGPGGPGTPSSASNAGVGEDSAVCTNGTPGDDGTPGDPGPGAAGPGTLSPTGYTGPTAGDGGKGKPGQGGGGGGGAKGGSGAGRCTDPASAAGASGGSGASGGCGGQGGRGGRAGGASIALLSLDAQLSFEGVVLRTGRGGAGGAGGPGQLGGGGGAQGGTGGVVPAGLNLLNAGCSGGRAGTGGDGGPGGGGLGGHALGIAFQGAAPPTEGLQMDVGEPGPGGAGADPDHDGAPGIKADVQAFP